MDINNIMRNKYGIPDAYTPPQTTEIQSNSELINASKSETLEETVFISGPPERLKSDKKKKGAHLLQDERILTGESYSAPDARISLGPSSGPAIELTSSPVFDLGEIFGADIPLMDAGMDDQYLLNDGFDKSRDIVGLTSTEGKSNEAYKFSVKFNTLQPGAEYGNLDVYLLIGTGKQGITTLPDEISGSTGKPWNIAIGAYDAQHFTVVDDKGQKNSGLLKDLTFNPMTNSVEFSLDKSILREKGWKDGEALTLQPFAVKDFSRKVLDTIDSPEEKPWVKSGNITASTDAAAPEMTTAPEVKVETAVPLGPVPDNRISYDVQARDPKEDMIYFVLTDRFRDGDPNNNQEVKKDDLSKYHGGDIQGLIDKLDYIKDLGMTSIWLTPPMKNQTHFFNTDGYHGYWPIDFKDTDNHVGTMEKFKELIAKAHEKGLKIILDIPLNHTAWEHPYYKDPAKQNWFHHNGDIKDWNDPWQMENCSLFGLPDLAQENPEVEKFLIDMAKFWVDTGIDGFRLDAVKNVPIAFWEKFCKEMHQYAGEKFFMVGEVFDGSPHKVNSYQQRDMSSLFDYPLYFTAKEVFAKDGSMRALAGKMAECNGTYSHPEMMSVFIDNHDTSRFLSEARGDKNKFKLALAFMMTVNRVPTVYYGTEVGMEGESDIMGKYDNRKDMEWDKDPELLKYFKKLTSIRNENAALRQGNMLEMWQDDQIYSFSRMCPGHEAIVVLNNGFDSQTRDIPLRAESSLKNGSVLKDLVSGETVTVQNGKIHVQASGKGARIFVPQQ